MTYSATKFEVAMSNRFGGDTFTKKIHYLTWVKVTPNVAQYPLHYVTYSATKFEYIYKKLQYTFTRNVTDRRTDDRLTLVRN